MMNPFEKAIVELPGIPAGIPLDKASAYYLAIKEASAEESPLTDYLVPPAEQAADIHQAENEQQYAQAVHLQAVQQAAQMEQQVAGLQQQLQEAQMTIQQQQLQLNQLQAQLQAAQEQALSAGEQLIQAKAQVQTYRDQMMSTAAQDPMADVAPPTMGQPPTSEEEVMAEEGMPQTSESNVQVEQAQRAQQKATEQAAQAEQAMAKDQAKMGAALLNAYFRHRGLR